MKVKILKANYSQWYHKDIGFEFNVLPLKNGFYYLVENTTKAIRESDCEVLNKEISDISEKSDAPKLRLSLVISCECSCEDELKKLASEFISSSLSATKGCEAKYELCRI